MYASVSSLPPLEPAVIASLTQFQLTDPGKRQWETSKSGYLNWAVGQLLSKARREEDDEIASGNSAVTASITASLEDIGTATDLRAALDAIKDLRQSFGMVQNVSREGDEVESRPARSLRFVS
jgi:kinetochore protein Mis12/MTW1